jgi:hypothetical protein
MTKKGLPAPRLSEVLTSEDYWNSGIVIEPAQTFPGNDWEMTHHQVLTNFHQAREQGIQPTDIPDGGVLPRPTKTEGLVRLVIDSYKREETRGILNFLPVLPEPFAGKYVGEDEFDATAKRMLNEPYFDENNVGVKRVTRDDGTKIVEHMQRRVVYVTAKPNLGWFSGFAARAMQHKPGSWKIPMTTFKAEDVEEYYFRVGDAKIQKPRDPDSSNKLWAKDRLTAAWVIDRPRIVAKAGQVSLRQAATLS